VLHGVDSPLPAAFKTRLQGTLVNHLDKLLNAGWFHRRNEGQNFRGERRAGASSTFEVTGESKFRQAALTLADQVLKDMRATKHGVLPIKEKAARPVERRSSAAARLRWGLHIGCRLHFAQGRRTEAKI